MKRQIFYWVRSDSGEIFRNVGFEADGTLHNPNGYPTEAVRAAVEATLAHCCREESGADPGAPTGKVGLLRCADNRSQAGDGAAGSLLCLRPRFE